MKIFHRGLFALLTTFVFQNTLFAEYLYKDEIIFNPAFAQEIEQLGSELHQKTGIALRLLMLKKLPDGKDIVKYEKEVIKNFNEPTILLTFSEMDRQVDILASDRSLYKYFDKKQVLSPLSSWVQAFFIALINMNFSDMSSGGTILPLLAQKAKKGEVLGKYSGAMFNGYADIAEQIADAKGVELEHAVGDANQKSIMVVKVIFYGFVIYGIVMYARRKIYGRQKQK